MNEYTHPNGYTYTEDELILSAKDENMTLEEFISNRGIKPKKKKSAIAEVPGKRKSVAKEDAPATVESTASKSVKPSSASQDNPFGEDKSQPEFLTNLQKQAKTLVPKTKSVFNPKKFAKEVTSGDTDGFYTKGEKNIQKSGVKENKLEADIVDNVFNNFETLNYKKLTPEQKLNIDDQAVQILQAKQSVGTTYNIQPADIELKSQEILTKALDKKNKIIGESYIDRLLDGVAKGADYVGESFASLPETVYRVFAAPQNIYAAISGDKNAEVSPEKFKKSIGVTNPIMDYFVDEQKRIGKKNNIYDNANYDSQSISENISTGNYSDAFRLLGSGLAESAPVSISMMVGGANMGIAKLATVSTVAMGGPEIRAQKEEKPGQSEIENVITGFGMAGAESVFSAIGEGSIGKVYKDIILKEGLETGSKIFKDGLINTYQTALKKYGVPASMLGEGLEEVATTVTQNLISKKPAFEGTIDSFISGVGGGVVYGSPITLQKSIEGFKTGVTTYKVNTQLKDSGVTNIKEVFDPTTPISEAQMNIALIPNSYKILSNQVDTDVASDKITIDEGDNIKKEFATTYHAANQLKPLELPTNVNAEVANLLKDRDQLNAVIKNVNDPTLTTFQLDKVKEINSKISDLTSTVAAEKINKNISIDIERTKVAIEAIGLGEEVEMPELNSANDVIDYLSTNTKLDENTIEDIADSYGSFIPLPNGKEVLIINKEAASMDQVVTTGQHEFLHKLIYKAVKNNVDLQKQMGSQLYKHIENYIGTEEFNNTEFKNRYDSYKSDFESTKVELENKVLKAKDFFEKGLIPQERYDKAVADADASTTKAEGKYLEEVLPLLSESLTKGDIKYNETFFTKIGDILRRAFQKYGLSKVKFNTGEDVFNFVRDYNKSFEKGQFTRAFKSLAKEGSYKGSIAKGNAPVRTVTTKADVKLSKTQIENLNQDLKKLEDEYDEGYGDIDEQEYKDRKANIEAKIKTATKLEEKGAVVNEAKKETTEEDEVKEIIKNERSSLSSDKVQQIYKTKGKNGADEIIKLFRPITKKIVDKRRDAPGFDRELLTDEIETGVGGILDLITKYKPESGIPLAAYINKYLPVRAIATSKRVLDQQFNKDASEEKGLMATETADQGFTEIAKEKAKYKNALEAKVFEPETLETINAKILTVVRTLKSKINEPVSLNKTVTPIIAEIRDEIGKQVDIDVKTAMGGKKDNQLKNWMLKNKKYVLENMTTTWMMGKDGQGGMPIAIQKQVDGRWVNFPEWVGKKIDREKTTTDQAGRTSGAELVRRLPNVTNNISDEVFLAQIIGADGNPLRGRKESLAKAIAEEASFDIINNDFENEGPIFDAFKINQERLGVELIDNIATEISRQIERGNVKFSMPKKEFQKVTSDLFHSASDFGIESKEVESILNKLPLEERERVKDYVFGDYIDLVAKLQKIKAGVRGLAYEEIILKELKKLKLNGVKIINTKTQGFDSTGSGDINIQLGNDLLNIEIKLNKLAQMGSFSMDFNQNSKTFNPSQKINGLEELSKKLKDKANSFDAYAKGAEGLGIDTSKWPYKMTKEQHSILKNKGLQKNLTVSVDVDQSVIEQLYNNKDVNYINIGKNGLFSLGKDVLNLGVPQLDSKVKLTARLVRGGDYNRIRVFPTLIDFNQKSKYNIDSSVSNNALFTRYKENLAIKENQIKEEVIMKSLDVKKSKSTKGISVFDFDDTVGLTKGSVLYTMPDGSTGKLNAEEFAKEGANMLDAGAVFDFSEFSKVVDGKPGPMVEKMKKMISKFGPENFFILTARPANAAFPIHEFLSSIGIDIPLENITGLGSSLAQSKADWMIAKAAEGYNDFYFSDDATQNVTAVKDALDVLDVKSKIQQAKIKFSKTISSEFNRIISKNTGIGPAITYSDIVAKRKGAGQNMFDLYVPASSADFELLLYNFIGKGQEGDSQKAFFTEALLKPYANGIDLMDAARQGIKTNYKELLKSFPGIAKKLEKLTPDGNFTYDQALRVAMWNESGIEIPGLSKRDTRDLTSLVNNDTELYDFMSGLIVLGRQGNGWIKPGDNWDSNTIISDLHNLTEGDGRKQFLAEFIENSESVFGKFQNGKLIGDNINKVEALYGTDVREAIEDVMYRMVSGKNRSQGKDKITNAWLSWVTGSTGTIMFLNTRSAALQLIGAVNFLNFRDNNPLAAGKAFANQPQYWEDFALIWNSNKMKERRGGLKEDVAAAEIANAAATSKNKPGAAISYLLKIGYTPTQLADSFAIASGGAPYYRNRVKSYLKEGDTQTEAENKAWQDFSKVSDETQQSADPRDISKQQASGAGRLLLTFQNTAMQQSRIVKKSFLDLKNGRGDAKTHIAKIAYYLAVQNLIFSVLQQGLFAAFFDEDDNDEEAKRKKERELDKKIVDVASGVVDSIVRGTGLLGGVLVTAKNVIKKYIEEEPKGYKADYTKVLLEGANISPPIGSKARKIYGAFQQTKFDKDLIEERGWGVMQDGRVHLGPMYAVSGKLVEATVNIPMERIVNKIENASQVMNSQNKVWQRAMIGMGWSPRSVGVGDTEGDIKIEAEAKTIRKEEGKIKSKETRQRTKDSIKALPMGEKIKLKKEASLKRRKERLKRRGEAMKKRKMG